MKNLKKLASVALALVMAMALMAPAFAAEPVDPETVKTTITVKDAYPGNTYNAYKIFKLESFAGTTQSYKIVPEWIPFFTTGAGKGTVEALNKEDTDLTGYVTWVGAEDDPTGTGALGAFAKAALEYAKDSANGISVAGTKSSSSLNEDNSNYNAKEDVVIDVTGYGWYLVDSSNGALCSLNAITPSATVTEKNPAPSIEKTSNNNDSNKQIGDTVHFTITVTAQKGAQKYVVHDVMGAGLALDASSIKVTSPAAAAAAATTKTEDLTDGCTFEVSFSETYLNGITEPTNIVIEYDAEITADALVEGNKIDNKAQLKYGDNEATPWSSTDTNLDVFEVGLAKTNTSNVILTGAEFTMSRGNKPVWFIEDGTNYTVCKVGTVNATRTIKAGNVIIKGLAKDNTYTLTETVAPDGYNALTGAVSFPVTGADNFVVLDDATGNYVSGGIEVENLTGAELPSTGGMGTTIFYAVGGVLLAGSAILFVTKKRMGE